VHTQSEYSKMASLVNNDKGFWIAMQRDPGVSGKDDSITLNSTFWYTNASDKNRIMVANNTWIRYRQGEDHEVDWQKNGHGLAEERCFVIHDGSKLWDVPCNWKIPPLCQYTNRAQKFSKTDRCVIETPIESVCASDPKECANECAKRIWCRSFNFVAGVSGDSSCQLFPWSIYEICPKCPATVLANETDGCYHFNYQPLEQVGGQNGLLDPLTNLIN